MSYGVREYGVRSYGDSTRVITTAVGGGDPIAATDTVTFSETATLTRSMVGPDTVTFSESATLQGAVLMAADTTHPQAAVRFSEFATLSVIVATVPPPSGSVFIKRVSPTMPAPTLDSRGRPT